MLKNKIDLFIDWQYFYL